MRVLKSALLAAVLTTVGCGEPGEASPQGGTADGSIAPVTGTNSDATVPSGGAAAGADAEVTGGAGGRADLADGGGVPGGGGGSADSGRVPRDAGDAGSAMQPSSGCGMEPSAAGNATVQVNGMDRQYVLALPQAYDKNRAYPLILAFHGAGLSGPQFRNFFNLVTPVGADGIVVYPTGTGGMWDVRRDLPFVDALITKLQSSLCIDAQRIFATGHSNGGFFTNALGCQRGDVLRAVAPMSGGQQQQAGSCKGEVAVWISHGASDNIVMTSYGRQTRDFWVRQNECDAMMSMSVMPSPCVEYQACAAGSPVRYCEYPGDHNLMANSAQTIWAFFKQL